MRPHWRKWLPSLLLAAACAGFLTKTAFDLAAWGFGPCCDPGSEANTFEGARYFLDQGPRGTYALPVYSAKFDTPVGTIAKSGVYTHYFPGPDYVMAAVFGAFGDSSRVIAAARLIPVLHTILAVIFLAWAVELRLLKGWTWGRGILVALLFASPSIYRMAIQLHGQAYAVAYLLAALGLGILAPRRWIGPAAAFTLGFLSNYMLLTTSLSIAAAPAVGSLLVAEKGSFRRGVALSAWLCAGLAAAFALHFAQVALFLGDAGLAWQDQLGTAISRGANPNVTWLDMIAAYDRHSRPFFRLGTFSMAALAAAAAWLHRGSLAGRARLLGSVALAFAASSAWIALMKTHSHIHTHLNPRVYVLLYATLAVILVSLAAQRFGRRLAPGGVPR